MDRGLIFKRGTTLHGAHPAIRRAIWLAHGALNDAGYRCVVTSLWDGFHSENSFHHYGMAVDLRSNEIPTVAGKRAVLADMRQRLGDEYDVLLEGLGTPNEHYHIEWEAGRDLRDDWLYDVLYRSA